jgi:hypothetical protein
LRILQTKFFAKFARGNRLQAGELFDAVERLENGVFDAHLGNGLFKQRVAREGAGRSGGFRTILIFRSEDRAIFVHGFAKNVQANITVQDLKDLRHLAKRVLKLTASELATAVRDGDFLEINDED